MKNLTFTFSFFFSIIFFTSNILAQGNDPGANLVPPSPEAAAFGEYGDIPVSEFSGVPNLEIPIYNLSHKGVSVPISLNYHSNGIRVNEEASNVGLGWSLNAGGMISRSIRGYDDFGERQLQTGCGSSHSNYHYINYDGYYAVQTQGLEAPRGKPTNISGVYDNGYMLVAGCQDPDNNNYANSLCEFENGTIPYSYFCQDQANATDTESDLYSFNFLGYSGKFFIDDNGNFQFLDAQNMKIEVVASSPSNVKWKLTTSDGNKFFFGYTTNSIQYTHTFSNSISFADGIRQYNDCTDLNITEFEADKHISAWYLSQIQTPNGQNIFFGYDNASNYIYPLPSYSESRKDLVDADTPSNAPNTFAPQVPSNPTESINVTAVKYNRVYLTSIRTPHKKVEFVISDDRDDLLGAGKIDKINISHGGELWKSYQLNYDYFISNANSTYKRWDMDYPDQNSVGGNPSISFLIPDFPDYVFTPNVVNKRLKLVSVQDIGLGGGNNEDAAAVLPHSLIYNEDISLPFKTSYAIDHWGYANGANQNSSLIPAITTLINDGEIGEGTFVELSGANRKPNADFADAWLLNQISYPSGGHSIMNYEMNSYRTDEVDRELHKSDLVSLPPIPTGQGPSANCDNIAPPSPSATFEIDNGQPGQTMLINAKLKLGVKKCSSTECNNSNTADCLYISDINNPNNDQYYESGFKFRLESPSGQVVKEWNWSEVLELVSQNGDLIFAENTIDAVVEKGTYRLNIVPFGTSDGNLPFNIHRLSFQVTWQYIEVVTEREGAGARISSINHYSDGNTLEISDSFSYTGDNGETSGKIYNYPWYHSLSINQNQYTGLTNGFGNTYIYNYYFVDRSSSSIAPLSSAYFGSFVGYKKVTSTRSGIGKTERYYFLDRNLSNVPLNYLKSGLDRFVNTKAGSLLQQYDYDSENNLVKSLGNSYESTIATGNDIHWNHKVILSKTVREAASGSTNSPMCNHYSIPIVVAYADVPQWHRVKTSTERLYCDDGDYTEVVNNYEYDNTLFHLKESYFTNSDGKEHRTKYHYATDDSWSEGTETQAIDEMVTRNMTGIPLRTESYVNGAIIGGSWTEYKIFYGTKLLPSKIHSHEGDWYKRAEFLQYANENPTQIKRRGWATENYTWEKDLLQSKDFNLWHWDWNWKSNRNLESFTNFDGQTSIYDYDIYQRLNLTSARGGQVSTKISYLNHESSPNGTNQVTSNITFSDAPNQENVRDFDGLGRFILEEGIKYDPKGNDATFNAAAYDGRGRNLLQNYMINTFSTIEYEQNPLDRIHKVINPDNNFKEYLYCSNKAGEVPGYPANELYSTTIIDENGNPTTTFTDKAGRTVAVRDAMDQLTTYRYEDDGDLVKVASPAGVFSYTYDQHHRVTSKSIPGGGTTLFTAYDERDLLLNSSDANGNSTTNQYNVYGQLTHSNTDGKEVITTYEFDRVKTVNSTIINPDGSNGGTTTQSYDYDGFGRVINQEMGAMGGTDAYYFEYDAADNVLESRRQHAGAHGFKMKDEFTYDHSGRLLQSWQSIDGKPKALINKNSYSPRDELTSKSLYSKNGGSSFLQSVGYGYNIMGWLETINGAKMPEIEGKIPACGLPSGPNAFPQIETEVNIETLFEIINNGDQVVIGDDPCNEDDSCDDCPQDCIPDCSGATVAAQQQFIQQYLTDLSYGNFEIPSNLHLVEFCDGTTLYIHESELVDVPGEIAILNTTYLNYQSTYDIYCDGESESVSVGNLLYYRSYCEDFLISGGNCEVIEIKENKECTYEIELENFSHRALQNTRDIEIYYDQRITETCVVNGVESKNATVTKLTKRQSVSRIRSFTNGSISKDNPPKDNTQNGEYHIGGEPSIQEEPSNAPIIRSGGYIEKMTVNTLNPDGYLDIVLDPNLVSQLYPNLPSDFDPTHLVFGQNTFNTAKAIKAVIKAAVAQWAEQQGFAPDKVIYESFARVNSNGLFGDGSGYYFEIGFYDFYIVGKPHINICDVKTKLVYQPQKGGKEPYTVYPNNPKPDEYSFRTFDYENTPCGYVSIKYDFTVTFTGDCGSLQSKLSYELTENSKLPELAYTPIVSCQYEDIRLSMECGPTISVCNGSLCTDCLDTPNNTPDITTNPDIDICNPNPPQCTPEQTAQQADEMASIMNAMENVDVDNLTLPINLMQIMLCDGTMVWVLEDLLDNLTTYTWIQTVTVNSTTDVFTVTVFPENDLFGMRLNYYNGSNQLQAEPYKNGNVSWMKWKVGNQAVQQYGFRYDELDRIENAYYQAQYLVEVNSGGVPFYGIKTIHQNRYNLFNIGYDGAGNITQLSRNGFVDCQTQIIDNLTYNYGDGDPSGPSFPTGTYAANQLSGVSDGANADHGFKNGYSGYGYDGNGNLTHDTGKKIDKINYNFLNLPRLIETEQGDMKVWYDATGAKQKKQIIGAGGYTKEYVNGVEYKDGELEAIYTGDGRIIYEEWDDPKTPEREVLWRYRYEFTLSDHLGNARVTFSDLDDNGFITLADDPTTEDYEEPVEMLQENHYYPFGMNMEGSWTPQIGAKNAYQFNGSTSKFGIGGSPAKKSKIAANLGMEFAEELGLNVNMAAIRTYDPAIGRFWQVDPFAEEFYSWTPYKFGMDNPILYADPNGDCEWCKEVLANLASFGSGMTNAVLSNATGNAPGTRANTSEWGSGAEWGEYGQQAGDILSVGIGATEQALGFIATGTGILAAPETGGLSLVISSAGTAGMVHGSTMTATGLNNLVKSNHGNSKSSNKDQHGYEITNETKGEQHKVGVSGGKLNKNGSSRRANSQVNKLNKQGNDTYSAKVKTKNVKGREKILDWEQAEVNKTYKKTGKVGDGQKRPKPKE